jgi:glycerate kinase
MTRVLIAFDKFKHALTAQQAGEAVAAALREMRPDWVLDLAPLADGGEGFAAILTRAANGCEVTGVATGPRGEGLQAGFGLVPVAAIPPRARTQLQLSAEPAPGATVAVIEMAAISGLALLPAEQRDPWLTTTFGTGELMRAAADAGAVAILLGVGGSATSDLGLGALAALGLEFTDAAGRQLRPPIPADWSRIVRITGRITTALPPVYIACDVTNPLLGPRGAAAVYGPQKGLRPADLTRLERESARLADQLCQQCGQAPALKDVPGAGAAGGIAFGLMTAVGAKLLPGFDLVSAWLDLETKLAAADIVITGEGRFDESSLEGKGPGAVAARALALGKTVHVFAGQVAAPARPGLALHAITPPGTPLAQALREAPANLTAAARRVFAR